MAFSASSTVSSSSNNIDGKKIDGKKSLFLLKKITTLTKLGYKTLNDNELNSTAENLIDMYLTIPEQGSDSIKKELQGLTLVRPNLANYTIKEIFHAALSELTGIRLDKTQEIHLNQIYTEQLLAWLQEEIEHLPSSSTMLLLNIYHSFSDYLSIRLNASIWQELLSLEGLNASQKKSLNQFKSKYESLNFCALKTSLIKIENTIHSAESTGDIKKLEGLYILWRKLVEMLVHHLDEDQKKYFVRSLNKNKKFVRKEGKTSDKEFLINTRKAITGVLSNFEQVRKEYRQEIFKISSSIPSKIIEKCLENRNCLEGRNKESEQIAQKALENELQDSLEMVNRDIQKIQKHKSELECCLQKIQDHADRSTNHFNADLEKEKKEISFLIERKNVDLQRLSNSRESMIRIHKECVNILKKENLSISKQEMQLLERDIKSKIRDLALKEQNFLSIISLSQWIINLLEKESQLINQLEREKCIAYEAAIKKTEDSFKEHSTSSKKSLVKSRSFVEDFSIASENISIEDSEEEPSISSFSESSDSILGNVDPFNEINRYLTKLKKGENTQLNGLLSQTMDGFLQALKAHLLKIKIAGDLKDQCNLQTKEIFDHLLLGTAGLELLIQAVYDQRTDHIALGFRTALLHCYYAIEQSLSQRIVLETNEILDKIDQDHNLLHLVQKTKIADIKRWKQFLREMTLHLAFSYPEDYRLFFQREYEQKAFSLLDDLSSPNLDNKKIKKALEFCFEMYSKSIAFITEISSAQIENQPNLLGVIQDLKKQIISTLNEPSAKKIPLVQSMLQLKGLDPTLMKIQKILSVLHLFLKDLDPLNPYFDEKDQKIYAAIGTVQSYLELMGISLEIPQNSSQHSLQKFIRIETIANVDKLFKHLFRAVILLENGEDNHQHALTNLFAVVADFYKRDDEHAVYSRLKEINLGISHHYLHTRKNNSKLLPIYNESLAQAYSLLNISDEYTAVNKKIKKSAQDLQKNISKINELVSGSLDLFMEFLAPTLEEIKKRYPITAVA